jgi:hypothetical protein
MIWKLIYGKYNYLIKLQLKFYYKILIISGYFIYTTFISNSN